MPASDIRIELLGAFRVRVGDREIETSAWPSRRAAELVQRLALDGGRLPREQVIEALWPHLDADAGAANLRKAAHHARQALGDPDAIVLRGGLVALFPGREVSTDVADFEAGTGPYGGDLLPDAPYETWTLTAREHLRRRHLDALRTAGDLEALVALDPTDEPAVRALMRGALERGSRPAAIRRYGALRSALRRELGLAPAAETLALYEEAVAGLAAEEPVFVGRELELARATAVLRAADGLTLLPVCGPGGIGKSAFCREVERIAAAEGWFTVIVAAHEAAAPYAPLLDAAAAIAARDPGAAARAGPAAAAVLARLAATSGRELTRHRVIGAFRRLLVAAAGEAPPLLVLDDAQLADEATLDALRHLGSPSGEPMVLVLAYRPEAAPDTLTRVVAQASGRPLDLAPLRDPEAAALISVASPTRRDDATVARILQLGEGNPFLLGELARSAVAGVPALAGSVAGAITARLVDLPDDVTDALRRLALAGDDLGADEALAVAGTDAPLDAGLRAGVLIVAEGRFRFRHDLVRQALVEQIPPHRRGAAHRTSAQRLAVAGADPGLVARHWRAARRPAQAEPFHLEAARRAVGLGAFADAIRQLDHVLEHAPRHPEAMHLRAEALDALGEWAALAAYAAAAAVAPPGEAHELRAKGALAQIKLGDAPGALTALATVEPTTLDGRLARALAYAGAAALGFGDPARGAAEAAEARRLAFASGDPAAVAVASWAQAAAAHAGGELRTSVRADLHDTHALGALATSAFDGQLCITQRLLYGARPYADVIAFADALEREATRIGAARGLAFAVTIRGEAKLLSGRLDDAEADLSAGVEAHRRIGAATGEAFATQRLAEVALHRGDRRLAMSRLDEALAIARESDVGFHLFDRIYGTLVTAAPDPGAALAALDQAEAAVRGPVETCPGCRITLAMPAAIAAARAGDEQRADRWAEVAGYLVDVVMRLPAWDAALEELRGHRARGDAALTHFRRAADGFAAAGQPLDQARCAALAATPG